MSMLNLKRALLKSNRAISKISCAKDPKALVRHSSRKLFLFNLASMIAAFPLPVDCLQRGLEISV